MNNLFWNLIQLWSKSCIFLSDGIYFYCYFEDATRWNLYWIRHANHTIGQKHLKNGKIFFWWTERQTWKIGRVLLFKKGKHEVFAYVAVPVVCLCRVKLFELGEKSGIRIMATIMYKLYTLPVTCTCICDSNTLVTCMQWTRINRVSLSGF